MAIDQLMVSFNLDKIECLDGGGTAEPCLWVVYFKIDGDTVFVGSDFTLQGSATVVGTSGSHGNLPNGVDVGDTASLRANLGRFKTRLRPIQTLLPGTTVGGTCGFIAILLDEDSTSDYDINVSHAALNEAVQAELDDLIKTLGLLKQDVTDDDIEAPEDAVPSRVESALADDVNFLQGILSRIGFGSGQRHQLRTAKFIGRYSNLIKQVGTTQNLEFGFNQGGAEASWKMFASVAVHKTSAAAIMRSGNWNSSFLFGRTTQQFVSKNQSLFDNEELRLLQMATWLDNGVRRWSSIHRSGDWAHALLVDRSQTQFVSETQDLFDSKGLRLEHMVTYEDNGVRRWAGSYRSGDWAHRLILDRDGTTFAKETQDLFDDKDLRLEQLVTYVHNGVRRWGGIYRSGDWAQRFTMDRDTRTFIEETREWLRHDGLRLIDFERYEVNGQARWAGAYRSGDWGQRLIVDSGIESLRAQTQHFAGNDKLRIVSIDIYEL